MGADWIIPEWPVPPSVHAAVSTRFGPGISLAPYDRFNLGARCGDDPTAVAANRRALEEALALPARPRWLQQVHGCRVVSDAGAIDGDEPRADAAVTGEYGRPLVILTADCLPVLFATDDGRGIGAAHAGWRGLVAGVLEATVTAMPVAPDELLAWLGPCIGPASYEVGEEVRQAFLEKDSGAGAWFRPSRQGHWFCDLAGLARRRLEAAGVTRIHGGGFDTLSDPRLYSYRRDGACSGRFASVIWRR